MRARVARSSRDLPMPASPDSSATWPSESMARRQRLSSSSTSSLRPTSGAPERERSALKRLSDERVPLTSNTSIGSAMPRSVRLPRLR